MTTIKDLLNLDEISHEYCIDGEYQIIKITHVKTTKIAKGDLYAMTLADPFHSYLTSEYSCYKNITGEKGIDHPATAVDSRPSVALLPLPTAPHSPMMTCLLLPYLISRATIAQVSTLYTSILTGQLTKTNSPYSIVMLTTPLGTLLPPTTHLSLPGHLSL